MYVCMYVCTSMYVNLLYICSVLYVKLIYVREFEFGIHAAVRVAGCVESSDLEAAAVQYFAVLEIYIGLSA